MDLVESVRHDAAALCQFIAQVSERCIVAESPSYTAASKEFFKYIAELGEATKFHLQEFIDNIDPQLVQADPEGFCVEAQQVQTIRYSWFKLHRYIKPALDADTLEVPHTLVQVLTDRLKQLNGFDSARFAVLHTSDLNYYQVNVGYVERLAAEIAAVVPKAASFPSDLGLIVIPYSQSSSLFLNTALAHEMGHYAFEKRVERKILFGNVAAALLNQPDFVSLLNSDPLAAQLCIDRCIGWLTEIYCDLFAVSLIGPCFCFGFSDLFALSRFNRNSPAGQAPSPIFSLIEFSSSHPADAIRLREQASYMKRPSNGWWTEVDKSSSSEVQLLRDASSVQNASFTLEPQADNQHNRMALVAFLDVVSSVHDLVEAAFQGVDAELGTFVGQRADIQKYLSFGVVPSRLVKSQKPVVIPSTVALLNAAYFFYLDNFDDLLNRIESARSNCLTCRALWAAKIELWTTKALEDVS